MEFGSLLLLVGVIGGLGIGISLLAKYTGVGEFLSLIMSFMISFFQYVKGILDMAPKFVKVGVFMIAGLGILGLLSTWILAYGVVCVENDDGGFSMYKSSTFMSAAIAKLLPDDREIPVDNAEVSELGIESTLNDTGEDGELLPPIEDSPGLIRDWSDILYNPLVSSPSVEEWGTFIVKGKRTYPTLPSNYSETILMAVPKYMVFTEADQVADEEGFVFGINSSFTLESKKIEMEIYRETSISAWFTGRESGRCYLDSYGVAPLRVRLSRTGAFSADRLATVKYEFIPTTYQGLKTVAVKVDYKAAFLADLTSSLDLCPQGMSYLPGEAILVTGSSARSVNEPFLKFDLLSYNDIIDWEAITEDNQSGWVSLNYVPLTNIGVDNPFDSSEVTRRGAFIKNTAKDDFTPFSELPSTADDVLTYSCDEEGDVKVLVWGLDVFGLETMLVLMGLAGIMVLLKKLNMI